MHRTNSGNLWLVMRNKGDQWLVFENNGDHWSLKTMVIIDWSRGKVMISSWAMGTVMIQGIVLLWEFVIFFLFFAMLCFHLSKLAIPDKPRLGNHSILRKQKLNFKVTKLSDLFWEQQSLVTYIKLVIRTSLTSKMFYVKYKAYDKCYGKNASVYRITVVGFLYVLKNWAGVFGQFSSQASDRNRIMAQGGPTLTIWTL